MVKTTGYLPVRLRRDETVTDGLTPIGCAISYDVVFNLGLRRPAAEFAIVLILPDSGAFVPSSVVQPSQFA